MKTAIVILFGLCVLAAQATKVQDVEKNQVATKGLEDIIDAIVKFATEAVNSIIEKAKEIIEKIKKRINDLVNAAKDRINEIRETIEKLLDKIAQESEKAKECADKYRPDMQAAVAKAADNLQTCSANALQQADAVREIINKHVSAINEHIKELQQIIRDCFENGGGVGCVIEKAQDIKEKIQAAIAEAKQAVSDGYQQIEAISQELHQCNQKALHELQTTIDEIAADIQQCLDESNNN